MTERIEIENTEARTMKWIRVEERLPEYAELALVRTYPYVGGRLSGGSTYIAMFIPPTKAWRDIPDGCRVTHWMPLPEPPEVNT